MSDVDFKHKFPVVWLNMQRYNKRLPVALEREQAALPKKVRKPKVAPFDGLRATYDVLDKYAALTGGVVACRKGCSFCCYSEVAVTSLEADFIAHKTGRSKREVRGSGSVQKTPWVDPKRPCPFLADDQSCSIYEHRPMVCRTHFNFDATNEACRFDADPHGAMAQIDRLKSFPGAMEAWAGLDKRTGGPTADIRDFFG